MYLRRYMASKGYGRGSKKNAEMLANSVKMNIFATKRINTLKNMTKTMMKLKVMKRWLVVAVLLALSACLRKLKHGRKVRA